MRAAYIAVALLTLVAGAALGRASGSESDPTGTSALRAPRSIPGDAFARPDSRAPAARLAQVGRSTAPETLTTGDPSIAPFKWAGMVEYHDAKDAAGISHPLCTGQFITANVVLTAAHCLNDPDDGITDPKTMSFWLQYQNGQATKIFKVSCGLTNPQWVVPDQATWKKMSDDDQNAVLAKIFPHDFAMLLVDGGSSPTGYIPVALDWKGKYSYAERIGYPENILGGRIVQKVGGIVFFADSIPLRDNALPNEVVQWGPVTDATQGMSGGAWVANQDTTRKTYNPILIAVTSYSPVNKYNAPVFPGGTFAAYLKAEEYNPLLQRVQNGCQEPSSAGPLGAPQPK
ncbi:MAG TPA: trypsin-like serine protease [Xanthobacteraceae bacterium]|nr:trypsin-like serine protease [Xanthobacteraceae bacterium]